LRLGLRLPLFGLSTDLGVFWPIPMEASEKRCDINTCIHAPTRWEFPAGIHGGVQAYLHIPVPARCEFPLEFMEAHEQQQQSSRYICVFGMDMAAIRFRVEECIRHMLALSSR
jgi:hypothetical protein